MNAFPLSYHIRAVGFCPIVPSNKVLIIIIVIIMFCFLKEEVSQRRPVIGLYTHAVDAFGYFYAVSWFDKTKDQSLCLRWGACLPLEQSIS